MTATAAPTSADKILLKSAIANSLDIDEGYLKDFTVVSEAAARRLVRRALLASYTWNVAFTVKAPLSETTSESSTSYSENLESALTSDSFVSSVSSSVGATVDVTSISSEVTTTRNTPQPTLSTVIEDVGEDDEGEGSSSNDESTSSAAMVVFVLVGVVVFAACIAGLVFLRRHLAAKTDDDDTINKTGTAVELTTVQVQTPTASPRVEARFEASMQSSKADSMLEFLLVEAKISSARALIVAEQFAKNGYESASDFEGMTAAELSDEHLRDVIGLSLIDMRKFRAASSRFSGQASTVGDVEGAAAVGAGDTLQTLLTGITSLVPPQIGQLRDRNFSVSL
jgi:hypothetical protein